VGGTLAILTVAGHTSAGGSIDLAGLALVTLLALLLGAAMSGVGMSGWRVLGVLLGGQALLHLLMTFTAHSHGAGVAGPSAGTMVTAHVIAALLATLVIVHADGLLAAWQRFLSVVLGVAQPRQIVAAAPVCVVVPEHLHATALTGVLVGQLVRRGPPAGP